MRVELMRSFKNVQSVNFKTMHQSNFDGEYSGKKLINLDIIIKLSNSISIVKKKEKSLEKYY